MSTVLDKKTHFKKGVVNDGSVKTLNDNFQYLEDKLNKLESQINLLKKEYGMPEESPELQELREKQAEAEKLSDQLDEDEEEETEIDDCISVCTEQAEMEMKTLHPDEVQVGKWSVSETTCKHCLKQQLKNFKKKKKDKEKDIKAKQKELKAKQKAVLEEEVRVIKQRIKNLEKGRDERAGIDTNKSEQLKNELRKLANNDDLDKSKINLNLYLK